MIPLHLVFTIIGLILVLLSIPLVLGKIGPNLYYGIRTREAFSSEENWYRINKSGGKILLAAACIMTLVGLVGLLVPEPYVLAYDLGSAVVLVGSAVVSSVAMLRAPKGK